MNFKLWMENSIKIFLDDERDPKDPVIQNKFGATPTMLWVKTAQDAIKILSQGNVAFISMDHDLGENAGSGYEVAKYIEKSAFEGTLPKLSWRIHSQNPVGARDIKFAMQSAERFWNQ
jgi:hypothetical protein